MRYQKREGVWKAYSSSHPFSFLIQKPLYLLLLSKQLAERVKLKSFPHIRSFSQFFFLCSVGTAETKDFFFLNKFQNMLTTRRLRASVRVRSPLKVMIPCQNLLFTHRSSGLISQSYASFGEERPPDHVSSVRKRLYSSSPSY